MLLDLYFSFTQTEYHETKSGFYQPSWMVNYPGPDVPWTRIAEYKVGPCPIIKILTSILSL